MLSIYILNEPNLQQICNEFVVNFSSLCIFNATLTQYLQKNRTQIWRRLIPHHLLQYSQANSTPQAHLFEPQERSGTANQIGLARPASANWPACYSQCSVRTTVQLSTSDSSESVFSSWSHVLLSVIVSSHRWFLVLARKIRCSPS